MSRLKTVHAAMALSALLLAGCSSTFPLLHPSPPSMQTSSSNSLHTHNWTLQSAFTAQNTPDNQWFLPATSNRPSHTVQLSFEGNQLHIARLCNTMNGSYDAQGQQMHIGNLASTMMACPDHPLMQLERKVGLQLPLAHSWNITNDTLEIHFTDGQRWQFLGTPKYSALYGQPERMFLEIAPQTSTCHLPTMRDAQCLQVRTVQYNEQGLKTHAGQWEHFYASIEGYTHQEGVRSIVRLNRYTRANVPADASRYIYVHDMTVESAQER